MITEMWDAADIYTDKWSLGKVRFNSMHFRLYETSKLPVIPRIMCKSQESNQSNHITVAADKQPAWHITSYCATQQNKFSDCAVDRTIWGGVTRERTGGAGGNHSCRSGAKFKNGWSYTSTPSICLRSIHSKNFTFTITFYGVITENSIFLY